MQTILVIDTPPIIGWCLKSLVSRITSQPAQQPPQIENLRIESPNQSYDPYFPSQSPDY